MCSYVYSLICNKMMCNIEIGVVKLGFYTTSFIEFKLIIIIVFLLIALEIVDMKLE